MSKYKKLMLCTFVAIFTLNSCTEEFLDSQSTTQVSIDEYYSTDARIFEALVAAYDPLHWFDYAWGQQSHLGMVSDVMADDLYVGGSNAADQPHLHLISQYAAVSTNTCSTLWTAFYSGVNRANNVMKYMPNVTSISNTNRELYLAEAKVLRAYYYNWLWKLWGNIPYYETNLSFPYISEQSTPDQVYEGIVTTLEEAIENGGLPMKAAAGKEGRVTKAMAYMLYTEVVMYQKDQTRYSTALGYMEEIINSGQYDLVDDFAEIWEPEGEWSTESIFEINYFNQNATRAWDGGAPLVAGGSVYPKLIGISGFEGSTYAAGWGFEPVREEAYDLYDDDDERKDGGILNFADFKAANPSAKYTPRYQDTGYFLKKYIGRADGNAGSGGAPDMNYGNNFRVYRFAETLLFAAELGSANAQSYLDQVRDRSGLGSVTVNEANILAERRLEFLGEGKRYWDLIRTGNAATVLVANEWGRTNWTDSKKHLPIPQADIDASQGKLIQNDY